MSSTDPMRDDSWILSETMRKISLRPSPLASTANTKVIIIDEADNTSNDITTHLYGRLLRFAGNCRFIFTCNYKNKILNPSIPDAQLFEFGIKGKDRQTIAAQFFKRIQQILDTEGIEYDNKGPGRTY